MVPSTSSRLLPLLSLLAGTAFAPEAADEALLAPYMYQLVVGFINSLTWTTPHMAHMYVQVCVGAWMHEMRDDTTVRLQMWPRVRRFMCMYRFAQPVLVAVIVGGGSWTSRPTISASHPGLIDKQPQRIWLTNCRTYTQQKAHLLTKCSDVTSRHCTHRVTNATVHLT